MKRLFFIFIILSGLNGMVNGQSSDKNYIKKRTYTSDASVVYVEDVEYYDGLGRPVQSVSLGASPVSGKDMVTLLEYDGFNRESKNWLPITAPSGGAYIPSADYRTAAMSSAGYSDSNPYAETIYEISPLGRVSRKYGYGAIFRCANASTDHYFMSNGSAAPLNCLYFYITGTDMVAGLALDGLYPDNKLYVNKTSDPDNRDIYEFVDFQGRTILSRMVAEENGVSICFDTYYVYDIYGNLGYVLPPELSTRITSVSGISDEDQHVRDFAFIYKYDGRGRLISKKLPGKEVEYFVYDKGDRLIMSQDGQMRSGNRWLYNVYDRPGRIVEKSIVEDTRETPFSHTQLRDYYAGRTPFMSNDPAENINILMPMGDDLFVVVEHLYSGRYGGQSYEVMIEPEEPQPYSPTYMPFVEGKYFVITTMSMVGGPGLNIQDPEGKYFVAEREVRQEYFIASTGSKHSLEKYYYIPEQYLGIVESTMAASDPGAYYLTDIFPLESEPLAGYDPDPNPTLVDPEPLYINFLEGQYFVIADLPGNRNVMDPHGMFFTGELSAKDKYFIGNGDLMLELPDGTMKNLEKYYYVPEHCLGIINNTITASDPMLYRITSELSQSLKNIVPQTGIINFTPEWEWIYFDIPSYLEFQDVAGIVSAGDVAGERSWGNLIYERNAVLGSGASVERAYYYDTKGRVVQIAEKNHLGGIGRYSTEYDFVGNVLALHESHESASGAMPDTKLTRFTYDHRGRLLTETTSLNGSDPAVVEYGYDELGKLTSKVYGLCEKFLFVPLVQGKYFRINMNTMPIKLGESPPNPDPEYFLTGSTAKEMYRIKKDLPPGAFLSYSDYYIPVELWDRLTGIANNYPYYEIVNNFSGDGEPLTTLRMPVGSPVKETYDYNIQGWLTEQSSELFDMQLKYYDPDLPASSGILPSYTGNITQWNWQHKDGDHTGNGYGFKYDGLSRLTDSRLHDKSGDAWVANNNFRETIGSPAVSPYDLNSNINYLKRTGSDGSVEDEFQYSYAGNQLTSLETPEGVVEYSYDANGNMDYDGRKDLFFQYNYLNLLDNVRDASAVNRADYTWLADGSKLRVEGNDGKGYVYLGSLVYKLDNGEWEFESTAFGGGRIQKATAGLDVNYQITDHLGSVRVVFGYDEEGDHAVKSQNDYHAFGLRHENPLLLAGSDTQNRFLYNGKEHQTTGSLGLLDYGARMYDQKTGRWFVIDPLAEKYYPISPFAYAGNNPIRFIDPDGKKLRPAANVSQEFMDQLKATVTFMNEKGTSSLLSQIEAHEGTIYIAESTDGRNSFNPNTMTISWAPTQGVLTDSGVSLSPATMLNHEADHALRELTDPEGKRQDKKIDDDDYGNQEEKRVITGSEQDTALKHGEIEEGQVTRTNHRGTHYTTQGPTTTKSTRDIEIIIQIYRNAVDTGRPN